MLIAQMRGVKKYYNDRLILKVDDFKIYKNDRIGIVGLNGSGKTTFLNILTNRVAPSEGISEIYETYAYITQLGDEDKTGIDDYAASRFGVSGLSNEGLSGGEISRLKIAKALGKENALIIGDEPASNLDSQGIELLQKELVQFNGAILVVSHDREFLDTVCNTILEIESGEVRLYKGNYSKYKELKEKERERAAFEYDQYVLEKNRLHGAVEQKTNESKTMRKAPKRMGNSEARLHKMGNQAAKAALDRRTNAIRSRIEKLETKEKPKELPEINLDIQKTRQLYSKVILSSDGLDKSFRDKVVFKEAQFKVFNNSKTAVIGPNGSGKTTLIKMIINGDPAINRAIGAKIGYFSQNMSILESSRTLLENVMESSIYDETFARILLARLLFKQEDVMKKVSLLSGGERVKAALAKIILSDFNVLVLDEPTNYLDIYSMEAVEEAILNYNGTVVFVSHDRRFVSNIADHIISIENQKTICFGGTYSEYNRKKEEAVQQNDKSADRMVLQHRMAEILGKLSMPSKNDDIEALDREYKEIIRKLREVDL
ncbi:ribosomal protection-like ABC-F family protein [Lutispora saccharofermentans]|uniref:ABC-F type ribosomal protection protein n=1 Tax=Lutispora saccharofermentans TaxID=3024236 RepID=A0ABT1NHN9_9FIRM|nr:ABC-F type ribosomal protection protein [Lutispora saccharofermentans]MCQ1530759.1 ABC-F type ribosomal protection protein [Lutispora saccharofermentans]